MPEFLRIARNVLIATLLAWLGFSEAPAEKPESSDIQKSVVALFG